MKSPFHKLSSAFSLVEVVMALGLATFALVSMMGLLSVGFRGARDSMNMAVISDIAQSLSGEAQLTAWTNLPSYDTGTNRYFDDLGKETGERAAAVYIAKTSLQPASALVEAGSHATNLLIEIRAVSSPQITNMTSRLLIKSE